MNFPLYGLGLQASVQITYIPGETFTGKVIYIYPALNPETRTAKVRFEFPNPGGKLKPEMYANVEIKIRLDRSWPFRMERSSIQVFDNWPSSTGGMVILSHGK